jgi:hypothetical protein
MPASVLATLGGGLLLLACTDQLDTAKLEDEITDGYEEQLGIALEEISCPDRDIEEGDEFECEGTDADGDEITFTVTQEDDEGNVVWAVSEVNGESVLEE